MSSSARTSAALFAIGIATLAACGGTEHSGGDAGSGGAKAGNGGTASGGISGAGAGGASGSSTGGKGAGGALASGGTESAGGSIGAGGAHTGGKSGAGGSLGSDAGTTDGSAPETDAGCEDQLTASGLSWGPNGGLVRYTDVSYLIAPRTYRHVHDTGGNAPPTCMTEIPGCPSQTLAAIDAALHSKQIADAISAHAVFGGDSRPVDGQVFRISVGPDYVDVGTPCSGPPCVNVPAALDSLVTRLEALDTQELAKKACTDVFGQP